MRNSAFKIISDDEVKKSITMTEAIGAMVDAFKEISSGQIIVPVRTFLENEKKNGMLLSMPCYSQAKNLYSVKLVSVFPENQSHNLPMIQGKVLIIDGRNGSTLAMMDAGYLTALRTGAASGLATKLLSNEDASVLAIIGTGKQAITQVEAVLTVRSIKHVLVKGNNLNKSENFCEIVSKKFSVRATPIKNDEELSQADVICTATNSYVPVIDHRFVKPGAHINAIGAYRPDMQEMPSELMTNAFIVVDQLKACLEEAGDIIIPIKEGRVQSSQVNVELGEILLKKKSIRKTKDQISVFKSVGNAAQDLAIGHLSLKKFDLL